jgi:1-deoxy-D-xylulose-5-phosphate reductoisomerase
LIHSFVEFVDGSLVAQLAKNDMKFPIVYALSYPERISNAFGRLDLVALSRLDFVPVEPRRYPALGLARAALSAGGGMPAVLNASNEVAVAAFLEGKISFPDIVSVVSEAMNTIGETRAPESLEEAERIDSRGREAAAAIVRRRTAAVAT